MKVLIIASLLALGSSIELSHLYPHGENDQRVPDGDSQSSPAISLKVPITFYGRQYESISVHTDGFVTLNHPDIDEALLAPYMTDLDTSNQGAVRFQEHLDVATLKRASRDIARAFRHEGSHFQAHSVFVATWEDMALASSHTNERFTFQCILVSDNVETFAIFLYPSDGMGVGSRVTADLFNSFSARAGYHDEGREYLDVFETSKLISTHNHGKHGKNGEWMFKVGGQKSKSKKMVHTDNISKVFKRQAFSPSSLDLFGDIGSDEASCNKPCTNNANCKLFSGGRQCCICDSGFFGNGYFCLPQEQNVRYNGIVHSDFAQILRRDYSENDEVVSNVITHAYVQMAEGRAFFSISGLSEDMQRSIQPVIDFSSVLGYLFATTDYPARNGMDITGGRITARTTLRSDDFQFMVDQVFNYSSFNNISSTIEGDTRFYGNLPEILDGETVLFPNFAQVYTRDRGSIKSEATRRYKIQNGETTVEKSYQVSQIIQYDTCDGVLDNIPLEQAVEFSQIYSGQVYSPIEKAVRFALNMHIRPVSGGDREPTEPVYPVPDVQVPTEAPDTIVESDVEEEEEVIVPEPRTECEKQMDEANRRMEADPYAKIQVPTCMPVGTFAPRQCSSYGTVRCWCVDQDTGVEIGGTMIEGSNAYELDCSDVKPDETISLTDCQADRHAAELQQRENTGGNVFMPRCTAAGAYEPLQQHPNGYYMCFDFYGEETKRSYERPDCLEPCEKEKYYAETNNLFTKSSEFVPKCNDDGSYHSKQCEATSCYCVDSDGVEIEGSRAESTHQLVCKDVKAPPYNEPEEEHPDIFEEEEIIEEEDNYDQDTTPPLPVIPVRPVEPERPIAPVIPVRPIAPVVPASGRKLVFAQSMGINTMDLPFNKDNTPKRAYQKAGQVAVGLAYDCSTGDFYWSDIYSRTIVKSNLNPDSIPEIIISQRIRSPEGLAIDHISGNIYWTDSGSDTIEVAKLDGSNRQTLVSTGLNNPRGIAVDPIQGRIYWTDWNRKSPKIMSADGDGSNVKVLVDSGIQLPNDITFDQYSRQLCFIDAGTKQVECMSPDGRDRRVVFALPHGQTQHPFGLAMDGNMLYYSNWRSSREHMHAVNYQTGEDRAFSGPRGAHGHVYGVTVTRQCRGGYNYCSRDNGGCPNMCLPVPNGKVCK